MKTFRCENHVYESIVFGERIRFKTPCCAITSFTCKKCFNHSPNPFDCPKEIEKEIKRILSRNTKTTSKPQNLPRARFEVSRRTHDK